MNTKKIKQDFPIFEKHPELVYLDNAATSQKPNQVIESIESFYRENNSNIGRGLYNLANSATQKYENSRRTIADFINAEKEEVIFVKNTTEAQNLLASSLQIEGNIVLSQMSHHSEQLPWREKHKDKNIKFLETKKGKISTEDAQNKINSKTEVVAIPHISNVFGAENPIEEIIEIAHENNALVVLDCAQSVPHKEINVKDLDVDFITFSGHKMLGPTGIGVLYGKKNLLDQMKPYEVGGGTVTKVEDNQVKYKEVPHKFEGGTPHIAGAIGLKNAVEYLEKIGMEKVESHSKKIANYTRKELNKFEEIEIISPENSLIISFKVDEIHAHDVAELLNQRNIAVRAGNHCAQPQHQKLNLTSTTRISPYLYNSKEDVKKLVKGIEEVLETFNV